MSFVNNALMFGTGVRVMCNVLFSGFTQAMFGGLRGPRNHKTHKHIRFLSPGLTSVKSHLVIFADWRPFSFDMPAWVKCRNSAANWVELRFLSTIFCEMTVRSCALLNENDY